MTWFYFHLYNKKLTVFCIALTVTLVVGALLQSHQQTLAIKDQVKMKDKERLNNPPFQTCKGNGLRTECKFNS